MSQSPVIMAFRKRMASFGYTYISIIRRKDDKNVVYRVEGVEPLGRNRIVVDLTPSQMSFMFR